MQRSNSNRDISNSAPAHMSHGGNTNFVYDLLRKIVQPTCQTHPIDPAGIIHEAA